MTHYDKKCHARALPLHCVEEDTSLTLNDCGCGGEAIMYHDQYGQFGVVCSNCNMTYAPHFVYSQKKAQEGWNEGMK